MSQCCGKIPTLEDVEHIEKSMERYGRKLQGDIGEQVAAQIATSTLHLTAEFFDQPQNGFDSVYRDSAGNLVIVESKLTEAGGMSALGKTKHGRQGSPEWIRRTAELMCNPLSSQYSPDNAKIGEEILRVGPENIRFVMIHINPKTLEADVHELSAV